MLKRWFILLLSCMVLQTQAQQYYNEWIDYSKTYYKFKIGTTGLYRISQAQLAAASASLAAADAASFQLWRNGVEVPVYTSIASGAFGSSDYIEFWGEMNDGKPDNPLYRYPDQQINNKWSLFTDSASYFLTVNTASANKRLVTVTNTIPAGATPEPYFMYTVGNYYKNTIHPGVPFNSGSEAVYSSSFEYGEGFTSNDFSNGAGPFAVYTENNLNTYTGGNAPQATVRMNAVGNNYFTRNAQLLLNGTEVLNQQFTNFDYIKVGNAVAPALLGNAANFTFALLNSTAATGLDRVRIADIELTYPRAFNMGGASQFRFQLPARSTGTYLEITGFNVTGNPVLYDLANGSRYVVDASNTALLKVFLQPTGSTQDLLLVNQDATAVKSLSYPLTIRNFTDYSANASQGDYLIITHNNILNGTGGTQPVEAYRQYRSSAAGGGYNARIYMIDQLIDQFGYGIKNSSLAIRNFLAWARATYAVAPRAAFLIGKGVAYNTVRMNESASWVDPLALVPGFGSPVSDVLLAAQGPFPVPLTPIGRVSVINGDELTGYLNKMKDYEKAFATTSPLVSESAWKKNVAHVIGANDDATINLLYGYMNNDKPVIQDTSFGANVTDFVKPTTNTDQNTANTSLANLMSSGLGLLTYFGHSSTSTVAFNLESPANFSNVGKYPVFSMMGCNVGDIFVVGNRLSGPDVISEKQVLAPNGGCIGMMAGTSLGYPNVLARYNNALYRKLTGVGYGNTLGELMQKTVGDIVNTQGDTTFLQRLQCEGYVLNGDPAIRFYQYAKPDYAIEDPMVTVNPVFISVAESKFTVAAKMMNLGKAVNRPLVVELKRTFPNQVTKVIERDTIRGIRYIDSLNYNLAIDPVNDKGLNKITITLDPDNAIDELYKSNNSITKEVNIYEDEIRPVFPYRYAIINNAGVKLAASTADPLAPSRTYTMEIDTTALFNSSLKRTQNITSTGGVLEFTPSITFTNNTVYYWRVSTQIPAGQPVKWNMSSFIYSTDINKDGFNQSGFYQFAENDLNKITADSSTNSLQFALQHHKINVKAGVFGTAYQYGTQFAVQVDDKLETSSACGVSGIIIVAINPYTANAKFNSLAGGSTYGSNTVCGNDRAFQFQYNVLDTAKRRAAAAFLDSIPDNYFVIVRNITNSDSASNTYPATWKNDAQYFGAGNTLYDKLKNAGFYNIDSYTKPQAFIFVYQKSNSAFTPRVLFSQGIYDLIAMDVDVQTPGTNGSIITPNIGVAKAWKSLEYNGAGNDPADSTSLAVIGIKKDGTQQMLQQGITMQTKSVDLSAIDANTYPYLKLQMQVYDTLHATPYPLNYWRVYYTPAPEGAVAPNLFFVSKDTLSQGEPAQLGLAFKNVSPYGFDSVRVKVSLKDNSNVQKVIVNNLYKPLIAADTIKFQLPQNVMANPGNNTLYIEFNPDDNQPEQYHFNNFLYKPIYVKKDSLSPYLDVTFDGMRILNKDIVSSKPDVLVKMTDASKWLLLNSPDMVKVQLRYPNGTLRDFNYNSDTLIFHAAGSGANNQATVNFRPYLPDDGIYELIVSGKDGSGNTSGTIQYKVAFQVINKPMISNMLNYPNPFTTSTAFVFTLTGSEVPQNLRIQILTITGKIVKEITKAELGSLRIGRNITEYKWDGTDQYGQKLANGVYLYRVITNLDGKRLDKYNDNSNTDRFFNKGYGKMYLMR